MSGVDTVEAEVRELVRRRGLDPIEDRAAVRRLVDEVVADYDERSLTSTLAPLSDVPSAARAVYDAVAGFGPLQRHLDDPSVEELWINEPGRVFIARRGQSELTTTILTDGQIRDLVEKMLKTTGRRIDMSSPFVDAMHSSHPGRGERRASLSATLPRACSGLREPEAATAVTCAFASHRPGRPASGCDASQTAQPSGDRPSESPSR